VDSQEAIDNAAAPAEQQMDPSPAETGAAVSNADMPGLADLPDSTTILARRSGREKITPGKKAIRAANLCSAAKYMGFISLAGFWAGMCVSLVAGLMAITCGTIAVIKMGRIAKILPPPEQNPAAKYAWEKAQKGPGDAWLGIACGFAGIVLFFLWFLLHGLL
jgi:hypothetical protein